MPPSRGEATGKGHSREARDVRVQPAGGPQQNQCEAMGLRVVPLGEAGGGHTLRLWAILGTILQAKNYSKIRFV